MSALRLIILALLIYAGYRLLFGGRKKDKRERKERAAAGESAAVSDILVEDPVCHVLVPKGQAIRLQHQGKIVYFCSEECCNTFIEKGTDA
ncbi:MAG: TRASH domain protein [Desulfocapsaceae bacterium]|nr:TRASH domain protein [Desulfocapsaceae bacterium]